MYNQPTECVVVKKRRTSFPDTKKSEPVKRSEHGLFGDWNPSGAAFVQQIFQYQTDGYIW